MKKVIIFPFHHDIEVLLKYKEELVDTEIIGILSYKEDHILVEKLCERFEIPILPYERLLNDCDAVVILDNYRQYSRAKYYSIIEDAINLEKDVFITPLAEAQLDLSEYQGKYWLLNKDVCDSAEINMRYNLNSKERLYDVEIPVVGVMAQGRNCGKFETQLLVNSTISKECTTAVLSTNSLGALLGWYTMPSFMFEPVPFTEKVFKFNSYVHQITSQLNPDVLIVGIPEGVVPFEKKDMNSFAEYALIITSAISIDVAVLCTYFIHNELIEDGMEEIMNFCEGRFGTIIGAVCVSNTSYEFPQMKNLPIMFLHFEKEYVLKNRAQIEFCKLPIFDHNNIERATKIINQMMEPLKENVRAI